MYVKGLSWSTDDPSICELHVAKMSDPAVGEDPAQSLILSSSSLDRARDRVHGKDVHDHDHDRVLVPTCLACLCAWPSP